jgi:hypothetical protein
MLRKLVFLLLLVALPGCIASEQQLFGDGLDLGEEFGFFTLNADDPEEGFLLVRTGQNNSYEMFGVDGGFSPVFVNRLLSKFLVLSGYSDENKEFYHVVLHQRGERFFMLNDGENDLGEQLERQKEQLQNAFDYKEYAYRVRGRKHLEELVRKFEEAVETGFFRESEVELVQSSVAGNANRLKALRQRIEDEQKG